MLSSAATCTGSLDGCHSTILRSDDVPGVHRGTGSSSSTRLSTEMSHVCGCYGTSSIYISHDHLHVTGTFGARPHSSSHRRHAHTTHKFLRDRIARVILTPRRARTQRVTADARTRPRLGTKRKIRIYLRRYRLNSTQKASTFSRAVEIPRGAPPDQCCRPVASAPSAPQVCRGAQGQGIGQEIGD